MLWTTVKSRDALSSMSNAKKWLQFKSPFQTHLAILDRIEFRHNAQKMYVRVFRHLPLDLVNLDRDHSNHRPLSFDPVNMLSGMRSQLQHFDSKIDDKSLFLLSEKTKAGTSGNRSRLGVQEGNKTY